MITKRLILKFVFVFLCLHLLACTDGQETINVKISEVVEKPSSFDGKKIAFEGAVYKTFGNPMVVYPLPYNKDSSGLSVLIEKEVKSRPDVQKFLDIFRSAPQDCAPRVSGKFAGIFHFYPGETRSHVVELKNITSFKKDEGYFVCFRNNKIEFNVHE